MFLADYLPSTPSQAALLLTPLLVAILLLDFIQKRKLPPSPPRLPFLGNCLSLPNSKLWLAFTSLSKIYGGIYTLHSGLASRIIISDPQIAHDLFSIRSSKYSSRPPMIVFGYYNRGASMIIHPYGPSWLLRRKVLHQFLKPSSIQAYKPRAEAEATKLIFQLSLDEGARWQDAIERYTASIMFTLGYGHRIDALSSIALNTRKNFTQYASIFMTPGKYLVESLPFLDYLPSFPFAPWKTTAKKAGDLASAFDCGLVDVVRSDLANNKGHPTGRKSLAENMLLAAQNGDADMLTLQQDPWHFAGLPSALFGGGAGTTIATLCATILGLLTHPWTFVAAQKELDEFVGKNRSPTFEDKDRLPYIEAIVKEAMRWIPVIPMGLPHATSEQDTYRGWTIPSGMMLVGNTWGMHYDSSYFPSPEEFAPERFLPEGDERFREELKSEKPFPGKYGHGGFGWGRRICAGADLAENNLWIAVAKVVWAFELMGVEGEKYEDVGFDGDVLAMVGAFKCRFRVRDGERKEVIEREMRLAEGVLEQFPAFE